MIKQSQVRPFMPVGPVAPVKMAAAVLIAGAAVTLAACSSGTTSSASKAATPHKSGPAVSPSMHPGSHTTSGSHMTTSASPAVTAGSLKASKTTCKHVAELRTSLQSLDQLKLSASSASKIRTELTNVQTQVAAIKSEGGNSALTAQMNQLTTSVDKVRTAAHGLSTPPTTAQVNAIVTALTQLKAQSKTAVVAMDAACPK
jgi:hypothetical protein